MENQYFRTFIGIPIVAGEQFLNVRGDLMKALTGERISWVDPERFHITLRFLGDTRTSSIENIAVALQENLGIPAKFHVSLAGLGSYGPRKNPRVIWLGFEETGMIDSLKREVDQALRMCGIEDQDQSYIAHLTLGRVRSLKDRKRFYELIEGMKFQFDEQILIDRLVFYRSELGGGGPVYTPLVSMDFKKK